MCELFYTRTAKLSLWSAVCEEYKLEKLQCCRGKPPKVITEVYLAEYAPLLLLRFYCYSVRYPIFQITCHPQPRSLANYASFYCARD